MRNNIIEYFIGIMICLMLSNIAGCAGAPVTPAMRVKRPWYQERDGNKQIELELKFSVTVKGDTIPLIGDESLLLKYIEKSLTELMSRRGYKIDNLHPDYHLNSATRN